MADHPIFSADMQDIVESFVVETREIFDTLDTDLLQLESNSTDRALVDQIFRAVHTVKGTSGFLSLEQLSVLAHHFEDVLNRLRRGELDFHTSMMDVMLSAFDYMKELLQQVVEQHITPLALDEVIAQLTAISEGRFASPAPVTAPAEEIEVIAPVSAPEEIPAGPEASIPDLIAQPEDAPARPVKPAAEEHVSRPKQDHSTETIRVEVGRLDNLMNLVGELVLGRNRLLQVVADGGDTGNVENLMRELADTSAQVDFITTELQSAIMRTRMVQIGRVFNKFPRVVRDLAKEFDKQIDLEIEGEETELDKSLIEEIGDPLVHLIRNAADHGIEQPEARLAAGKPAAGRIQLTAAHEGNHIVIKITDDGAGMDPARLKQAAVDKGILTRKEAAEMGDSEAFGLIFRPGFSTAKKVSQVSGRGVGMDVVKTNITKLNGTVSIDSELGRGTVFTLKLPLTLAIIQSLLVRVGEESFAVPLHSVIEVVSLQSHEVSTIRGREVIRLREQVLPLLRISEALGADSPNDRHRAYAVIVGISHYRLGLVVDDLIGQKEIVIKPLGDYLRKIPGIAGSTIMGDGRVIMIVDVAELVRMENDKLRNVEPAAIQA